MRRGFRACLAEVSPIVDDLRGQTGQPTYPASWKMPYLSQAHNTKSTLSFEAEESLNKSCKKWCLRAGKMPKRWDGENRRQKKLLPSQRRRAVMSKRVGRSPRQGRNIFD